YWLLTISLLSDIVKMSRAKGSDHHPGSNRDVQPEETAMSTTTRTPLPPTVYVTAEHGVYDVDSATYPGLMSYVVDLRCPTCHTCPCPAFAKWGGACKHIKAARDFQDELIAARAWADFWNEALPARFTRTLPVAAPVAA